MFLVWTWGLQSPGLKTQTPLLCGPSELQRTRQPRQTSSVFARHLTCCSSPAGIQSNFPFVCLRFSVLTSFYHSCLFLPSCSCSSGAEAAESCSSYTERHRLDAVSPAGWRMTDLRREDSLSLWHSGKIWVCIYKLFPYSATVFSFETMSHPPPPYKAVTSSTARRLLRYSRYLLSPSTRGEYFPLWQRWSNRNVIFLLQSF